MVSPTTTTTYTFTSLVDAVRCSTPAGSVTLTLPTAGTTLSNNNESATCLVNQNGYINFYHSSGRLIASVNSLGQNLGNVTMTSYVDASGQTMPACLDPTNPSYFTAAMRRHWVITPTIQPTTPVVVRLPFRNSDLTNLVTISGANSNASDNVSTIADLKLSKYSGPNNVDASAPNNCPASGGSGGTTIHAQASNGVTTSYSSVTAASFTTHSIPNFSEFWLHGSSINSPLPVTLVSFEANCDQRLSELTWRTSSEQNSSHFTIERSKDGITWENIGEITAAGNSTQLIDYKFIDDEFQGQTLLYYRLIQVDFDGASTPSDIISVNCETNTSDFLLVPNPANDQVTLIFADSKSEGQNRIVFTDVNGRVVKQIDLESQSSTLDVGISELSPGCYFVQLQKNNSIEKVIRLIKK